MNDNQISNHQCMWIRLPDVLHPLDTCPVRFYIPCIGELAHGAHAFYPDACPHCKKRVAVASSPVETTAFRGLKSISYRPDLPLVDLVMTFDSMEAAQAARERVTALVMRPVEPKPGPGPARTNTSMGPTTVSLESPHDKDPPEAADIASGSADLCSDCPPVGYPTDTTRCMPCPRRSENGECKP